MKILKLLKKMFHKCYNNDKLIKEEKSGIVTTRTYKCNVCGKEESFTHIGLIKIKFEVKK